MNGRLGFTGQSPVAAWRSVWQTPLASIFTSTCPGPGSGIGSASITSGSLKALTTAARIVVVILHLIDIRVPNGDAQGVPTPDRVEG
jgi:hypothetical protein